MLVQPLKVVALADSAPRDQRVLLVAGPPPVGWGANFGIRFSRCYDASAYLGFEFRVRGPGTMFVGFQTMDSVPLDMGGRCTTKCWFTGGRYLVLEEAFTTHRILWSDVSPPDPSSDVSRELLQISFNVQSGTEPYELWLDDLRLISDAK
jgi:hypothetical protein